MRKDDKKGLKNKHDEPSMVGQILWNRRCFYSTEFLFISILIYIYYICGGKCKLTITCSFVFLAVILGSNNACLRFSARAVLILEDSAAFFYSVWGPVGASMLRYHEERVSVRSQHRRRQDASQVKIVAKNTNWEIIYTCRLHMFETIYLPFLETLLCLVI